MDFKLKVRGQNRRNPDSPRIWGFKLSKGFVERRRKAERRQPELSEGCLEEFEALKQIAREATDLDKVLGRL